MSRLVAEDISDAFDDRAGACLQLQEAPKCEAFGNYADVTQRMCPSGADFLQFDVKLAQFGCLIRSEVSLSGSRPAGANFHCLVFYHTAQCYAEPRGAP